MVPRITLLRPPKVTEVETRTRRQMGGFEPLSVIFRVTTVEHVVDDAVGALAMVLSHPRSERNGAQSCEKSRGDNKRQGASGKTSLARVRRIASRAPMLRRRAVSRTERTSA